MQKEKLTIGFDCDDVLVPFTQQFLDYHNRTYGSKLALENMTSYGLSSCMRLSPEELKTRMIEFCNLELFDIPPYIEATAGLEELSKDSHEIYLISSRNSDLQEKTENWAKTHFPKKFSGIYLTNSSLLNVSGVGTSKAHTVKRFGLDVFVEDCFETCEEIAKNGNKVIMLERPWNSNKSVKADLENNIYRVNSWDGIVRKINEMSYEKFQEITHQ